MRPAVAVNYEAEREAGMVPAGPMIRLDVTPAQLMDLQSSVLAAARAMAEIAGRGRDPLRRRVALDGAGRMVALLRLLQR